MNYTLTINPAIPINTDDLTARLDQTVADLRQRHITATFTIVRKLQDSRLAISAQLKVANAPPQMGIVVMSHLGKVADWLSDQGIPAEYLSNDVEVA